MYRALGITRNPAASEPAYVTTETHLQQNTTQNEATLRRVF